MAPPEPDPPTNGELAAALEEVADLLALRGDVVYKTVAYRRAAEAVAHHPASVAEAYRLGHPPTLPGVGKTISDALAELSTSGRLALLDELHQAIPPGVRDLLTVAGIGPKTARLVHERLGVTSIDELRSAAETGALRSLPGLSERGERTILDGIAALERRSGRLRLDRAERELLPLVAAIAALPGVARVVPAGSYRRREETIGDIDLLIETDRAPGVLAEVMALPMVASVVAGGDRRAAVRLQSGTDVDLMTMPSVAAGSYLVHLTGSKEHNVRLRGRARERGWSLSELGFTPLDAGGEAAPVAFATEDEVYRFLDLAFIDPELREDRGEIEASDAGRLPRLVGEGDLQGDLHSHSEWTDGTQPIAVMAEAARRRGHSYLALTDHTQGLAVARGLDPARFAEQRRIVDRLNAGYEADELAGRLPPGATAGGFRLLHGCELEIRADGQLDLPDASLASFDLVVASLHVGRRQPRERLTERVLTAIRSPHVDVIAHPAGRKIDERPDLDLDWPVILAAAAETGTALEINGDPHRLDLAAERARAAVAAGCLVSIDSDAHHADELDYRRYGVWQARRGWVEPASVLNAMPCDDLLAWLAAKPSRVHQG